MIAKKRLQSTLTNNLVDCWLTVIVLRSKIRKAGKEVIHRNCIRCHSELLTDSRLLALSDETHIFRMERQCIECHRETPHGRINSLSSVPYARVPLPGSVIPEWMKDIIRRTD